MEHVAKAQVPATKNFSIIGRGNILISNTERSVDGTELEPRKYETERPDEERFRRQSQSDLD